MVSPSRRWRRPLTRSPLTNEPLRERPSSTRVHSSRTTSTCAWRRGDLRVPFQVHVGRRAAPDPEAGGAGGDRDDRLLAGPVAVDHEGAAEPLGLDLRLELARGDGLRPLRSVVHGSIVFVLAQCLRAVSSVGRALPLHGRGRRFEPGTAHMDLGIKGRVALVMGASQGHRAGHRDGARARGRAGGDGEPLARAARGGGGRRSMARPSCSRPTRPTSSGWLRCRMRWPSGSAIRSRSW